MSVAIQNVHHFYRPVLYQRMSFYLRPSSPSSPIPISHNLGSLVRTLEISEFTRTLWSAQSGSSYTIYKPFCSNKWDNYTSVVKSFLTWRFIGVSTKGPRLKARDGSVLTGTFESNQPISQHTVCQVITDSHIFLHLSSNAIVHLIPPYLCNFSTSTPVVSYLADCILARRHRHVIFLTRFALATWIRNCTSEIAPSSWVITVLFSP